MHRVRRISDAASARHQLDTGAAGGVSDLGLSWLLAALLIPVFIVGKAYLGRKTGTLLLAVYVVYALARVSQDAMPQALRRVETA